MSQAISLAINSINNVDTTATYLLGSGRIRQVFADPADEDNSVVDLELNQGTLMKFGVNTDVDALQTAIGTVLQKSVKVSVVKRNGQAQTAADQLIHTAGFVYATANPGNANQSIVFYQEGSAMVAYELVVAHSLSALATLLNA